MTLLFMILIKNASFRSYGTFAYLLRMHIRNINMHTYIASARGHELSGRVRAHHNNIIDMYNLIIMHRIIMLLVPGPVLCMYDS